MSLTTTERAPVPASDKTREGPEQYDKWAICCSGGGIRSATYCLGGLQSLDEGGLLGTARWIVGVSGGSYIAASRALVARGLRRDKAKRQDEGLPPSKDKRRAYARGTPEEDNLRNNTHYIAPDAKTMLVAVLSLLLGAAVIAILVFAPLYAFGHVWGWLLGEQGVLTWSGGKATASISAWTWWLAPAAAAAITVVLFGRWWFTLVSGSPGRGAHRARLVGWTATITAALAVLMLAVPFVIQWLYHSTGPLHTVVQFFGIGGSGHWTLATFSGLIAAMVALARSSQKQLAKLSQPAAATGSSPGFGGQLLSWIRAKLTPWITSIIIVGTGAFITVLWISTAARLGFSASQLWPVLIAVGIMVATRAVVDINRTSLHDFYRWRLADGYAVTRGAAEAKAPETRQELFAEAAAVRLSDLSDQDGPELVIATTANINADRMVPPGRGGFCLAFDPKKVTLRGDPSIDEADVEVDTTDYEHLLGRLTLFDVVAISGAAFSPLMGSATRSASRIMLTMTNLRLGVWMPHPTVVARAREYAQGHPGKTWRARRILLLLFWYVLPHPSWYRDPTKQKKRARRAADPERAAQQKQAAEQKQAAQRSKRALAEQREAELWAHLLERRKDSVADERGGGGRLLTALCWRVMQPTLGMLWAEAAGHTSYRATWINVTDGGHYDNLGLVEALRRGAENVVALDASGDSPHTWFTLGGAIALARADAEVNIDIDPSKMIRGNLRAIAPGLTKTQVVQPWAYGTFAQQPGDAEPGHRAQDGLQGENGQSADGPRAAASRLADGSQAPNGEAADRRQSANGQAAGDVLPSSGNLWVCKLGWWNQAPWDVRAYAAGHSTYPCDPTMEQLYDGAEFDAYHELGACSVMAAAKEGRLPLRNT